MSSIRDSNKLFTLLTGIILALSAAISGYLTIYYGRRKLLIIGFSLCSVTMVILGLMVLLLPKNKNCEIECYSYIIIILFFLLIFGTTLGPITWIYNCEILSEKGVAISCAANWISAGTVGIVMPYFKR